MRIPEEEKAQSNSRNEEPEMSQRLDILTLDQIPKANESKEEFKANLDLESDSSDRYGLDMVDLEMRLNIEVSGPRWFSENIAYGHYVFNIKSYRSGPSQGFQLNSNI